MRTTATVLGAVLVLAGARGAREVAMELRAAEAADEPFAPSVGAAPFVSLGYREAMADLLLARVMPYFGGTDNTAYAVSGLCEAIVAVDPSWELVYEWCARAMTLARKGVDQATYLRAIALLEGGAKRFPNSWRIPYLAGQLYMLDLKTDDTARRRAWDERGSLLLEAAVRKPGAPADAATTAATLRTRLGQHQRAVEGLREMLLITNDTLARKRILDKLAELEHADADAVANEILEARRRFDKVWEQERPAVTPTMFILMGPRLPRAFDLRDLATGGRDLLAEQLSADEALAPPSDPPAASDPVP